MLDFVTKTPTNYSINLMWINSKLDTNSHYILQNADKDAVINKILTPAIKWKKANPEAEVNCWYDSHSTSVEAIQNTEKLTGILLNPPEQNILLNNIQFRDIREISLVKNNPDVFSNNFPLYFIIDLLKLIICAHCIENLSNESAIFSDLEIGDKRKNQDRMSKDELFNDSVMERLNNIGALNGPVHENQFFQVLNKPETITAIKHIINANLYRAITALNYKDPDTRRYAMNSLSVLAFNSTRYDLFHYLLHNIKVKPQLVGEAGTDEIDYNPLKHGYMPFGNFYHSIRNIPYIEMNGNLVERFELTTFSNILNVDKGEPGYCGRSDLKVRLGNDHQFWFDDSKIIPAADGSTEYKCTFWNVSENEQNYFIDAQNNSKKASLIPKFLIKMWQTQELKNTIKQTSIDIQHNSNNATLLPALELKKQQDKNVRKRKFETIQNETSYNEPEHKKKKIEKKETYFSCLIA